MRTIAIISQKGGAGKTTLAVHLATAASHAGHVSLIVDTDPQATASRWSEWRGEADPEVVDCGAPSLLAGKLKKAAELGAEIAVIDTPPHADAMARQAAKVADLILIPCRPRAFDLAAIEATSELVKASRTPAFVIFNAGPPRARRIYQDATNLLSGVFGMAIAPMFLPERAAFHHSTASGLVAGEFDGGAKAALDARALWRWTSEQLNMPIGSQFRGQGIAS